MKDLERGSRGSDRRQTHIVAASAPKYGGEDETDGEANPQ